MPGRRVATTGAYHKKIHKEVELMNGHVQFVAVCVFQVQELHLDATSLEGYQAQVAADTIFLMDDR